MRLVASNRKHVDDAVVRYTYIAAFVAILLIGLGVARAEDKQPEGKPAEGKDVLATLRPGHPRLLWLDDDVARTRSLIASDPLAKEWFDKLHATAEAGLSQPVSEYKLIGPRLLQVSRTVLGRVTLLAGMYRLTGDQRFADRARAEMVAAAKFQDWHPPHFLDTAEMTNGMAIGYDWLYAVLTPEERAMFKEAIVEKGLKPGLKYQSQQKGPHTLTNNWNEVTNGGLTSGALAVADEAPDIARQIIENARTLLPISMKNFGPDGGWDEGPGYWSYATRYAVFYAAAMQSALGDDFGFTKTPGFAEAGMFRMQAAGPLNQVFNFADAGPSMGSASQMFWLAKFYDKPVYAAHERLRGQDRGRIDPFHLFWFNSAGDEKDVDALPTAMMFKRINVAFMRSSWTDDKAGFVGFKGGDNAASHGHADLGTFVYDADGARWAMDLGADDYNLPAYFGAQRFTYYRTRTEGHNTLTIGTENQNLKGGVAPIVAFSDKAGEAYAVADLTAGYAPKASRVQRGVQLLGRQLLVQDEVDAGEPIDLVWNFHTDAKVTIESNGHFATLTKSGKSVAVRIIEPDDARFAIVSANPPAPQMQQPNVSNLTIRQVGNIKSLRLAVLIAPKSDPLLNVKLRPLAEWDH